ncbi:peroxiredoxin [uncultured Coprobacter sp.]|jgi:ahpC/TSA family|uniref:peroxiredoxin family protein n=1 Tax=uncultured Coprobacter sp. TaxID=1720550 RepID=UPI0025DC2F8D|nr:redoxin domain-containing protein [uncultured Coprobacter sp.]
MIKKIICLIVSSFYFITVFSETNQVSQIISRLNQIEHYRGEALFRVTLPMTDEEVEYRLSLRCQRNPTDTLYGYSYFIDLTSESNPAINGNFIYYDSGNYYNFSNQRLREYHAEEDTAPFHDKMNNQNELPGIHRSGLFIEELPMEIASRLQRCLSNPENRIRTYSDTLINNRKCNALYIDEYINGEIIRSSVYIFDSESGTPIFKEVENNPGHLGSQTVTVKYISSDIKTPFPNNFFSEENFIEQKGNIIATFRSNYFKANNLTGKTAPNFSLPLLNDEKRFDLSEYEDRPLILAFVDTTSSFCKNTLDCAKYFSDNKNLLWITLLSEKNSDDLIKYQEQNELPGIVTCNAQSIAAKYGIANYPTLFVISPERKIISVQIGYDPDLIENLQQILETLKD